MLKLHMELNIVRFNEVNIQLLLCLSCLNPSNFLYVFSIQKILKFAKFYPTEPLSTKLLLLENELHNYCDGVKDHIDFFELKVTGNLAKKMFKIKKDVMYPLVYCLIKFLPNAIVSVERAFCVRRSLRNRTGIIGLMTTS